MSTLNRDIQQLELSHNNITRLNQSEFYNNKFRNLQKIYLNSNQVHKIEPNAFYKLTGLIELDLSNNLMTELTFSEHQSQLTISNLSMVDSDSGDNMIATANNTHIVNRLKRSFLYDLVTLRQLNLASNQLTELEAYTFVRLGQLRQLILSK